LIGERGGELEGPSSVPINQQPAINTADVEHEIRARVNKYSGEELVRELTTYCLQSIVEVVMTCGPNPRQIGRLDDTEIALLREMSSSSADD
jgi:hypothetical protein